MISLSYRPERSAIDVGAIESYVQSTPQTSDHANCNKAPLVLTVEDEMSAMYEDRAFFFFGRYCANCRCTCSASFIAASKPGRSRDDEGFDAQAGDDQGFGTILTQSAQLKHARKAGLTPRT